jgi:hypothetical protein
MYVTLGTKVEKDIVGSKHWTIKTTASLSAASLFHAFIATYQIPIYKRGVVFTKKAEVEGSAKAQVSRLGVPPGNR